MTKIYQILRVIDTTYLSTFLKFVIGAPCWQFLVARSIVFYANALLVS